MGHIYGFSFIFTLFPEPTMKRPTRQERQAEPKTPGESLFLERALAYYRETQAVGDNAAYGQVINDMDAFAFTGASVILLLIFSASSQPVT